MNDVNILVMSDTHGNRNAVSQLLSTYLDAVSAVIHLGDHSSDISPYAKNTDVEFHIVSGNTDPTVPAYTERVIEISGKKIFITHGHKYDVKDEPDKLIYKAAELGVDAFLFGHSHKPIVFEEEGILFLNPGSTTKPAMGTESAYALLRVSAEGKIKARLHTFRENI